MPAPPQGGPQPILVYFSTLLERVKLNEIETLELSRAVLAQNKINLIEQWMAQDKLTLSEALGEEIRKYNPQLAMKVFASGGSPDRVVQGFIEAN